jgi:hypothetical protein
MTKKKTVFMLLVLSLSLSKVLAFGVASAQTEDAGVEISVEISIDQAGDWDLAGGEERQKDALPGGQTSSPDIEESVENAPAEPPPLESVASKDESPEPRTREVTREPAREAKGREAEDRKVEDSEPKKGQEAKARTTKTQAAKTPAKPRKPAPPRPHNPVPPVPMEVRRETVYNVTLGSGIDEALTMLGYAGYPPVGMPFVKKGKTYYAVQGLPAVLPFSLTDRAVSWRFYVTAYHGSVSSVVIQLDYDGSRSFEDLKNAVWNEFSYMAGVNGVRGVRAVDRVFGYEVGAALSNAYGIWMYVTDNANRTCRLEIEHVDLTNLSYYWMAGGQ